MKFIIINIYLYYFIAAYFLNPMFQYESNISNDEEVRTGIKEAIKRLEPDLEKQVQAMNEIRQFVNHNGEFGSVLTKKAVKSSLPGIII